MSETKILNATVVTDKNGKPLIEHGLKITKTKSTPKSQKSQSTSVKTTDKK